MKALETIKKPTRRRCVTCRLLYERSTMIRVLHSRLEQRVYCFLPAQSRLRDAQGRSVYVCCQPECLKPAVYGKKLQKSLKTPLAGDIVTVLEAVLQDPASVHLKPN